MINIKLNKNALRDLDLLIEDNSKARILKDVRKTIKLMEKNLRHPSLNTHPYYGFKGSNNEKIFTAYAQNKTSAAYRIFWHYGPGKNNLTIIAIIAHP